MNNDDSGILVCDYRRMPNGYGCEVCVVVVFVIIGRVVGVFFLLFIFMQAD